MGANLRYIALRKRLAAMLAAPSDHVPYQPLIDELYRGLPHYTAIAIFAVTADGLTLQASHSVTEQQAQQMTEGLAAASVASIKPLLVPEIAHDARSRPISETIIAELVVPVLRNNAPILVIDIQSERYASLGRADQELLTWLAREMQVLVPEE